MSGEVSLTDRITGVLKRIPRGKVTSYGQVAALAGIPRGARQVVRVLHTLSEKRGLPWHRVVNVKGQISLPPGGGFELQAAMLRKEAVRVSPEGQIDLARHGWRPAQGATAPRRQGLGDQVARILGCEVAQADGDGIAHYLIDLAGNKPVDVRPPERWTARTLAGRLALDVCDADGSASLSLHGPRGEYLWVQTGMRVERVAACRDGDERGLVMRFSELPGRVVEVTLAPVVSVRVAPAGR